MLGIFWLPNADGFTLQGPGSAFLSPSSRKKSVILRDVVAGSEPPTKHLVQDANGKDICVGCVVRVCKEGLKAFQVPANGKGSYNDDKDFVPDETSKFLVLPVGLQGTVKKIYDVDISANHPVQVKFEPGENTGEGYDAPVAFLMHFSKGEIECV